MYSVKCDGVTIYNDVFLMESAKAVNPKLTLKDNSAGTLEITMPPGNAGYDKAEKLISEIIVYRDNIEIWSGRIIKEKKDFWNNRILTCEGELAYLNDTTQPPNKYDNTTIRNFLNELLKVHNQKVSADKQFTIGAVTFNDADIYSFATDDDNTFSVIVDSLIDRFGGHLRIRKENGVRYLDYLKEWSSTNTQEIRFGQNLLDFTRNWDVTNFVTVVMPKGERLSDSSDSETDTYVDVSSVNGGSRYVTNEAGIKRFGWIEAVVEWSDISEPSKLLTKARNYLADQQFDEMVIEVSAVDLRYLGVTEDSIRLLDEVRCISYPHGMDRTLPVSELTIQLDKPENSTYVLSSKVQSNFTSSTVNRTENKKTMQGLVQDAFYNATQIINSAIRGYVTITRSSNGTESIAISSDKTYNPDTDRWSASTKLWRWNINGLGYSKDGGRTYSKAAITMDGSISADFIRTGTLTTVLIRDESGNSSWNLKTGEFTMKHGSISLGISKAYPNGRFHVDDAGKIRAEYGIIGGFTINEYSIYNDVLTFNSRGMTIKESGYDLGYFGSQQWHNYPSHKGITMSLEYNYNPRYVVWANMDHASDDYYTVKLAYASKSVGGGSFKGDRISLGCNLDGNNWTAENLWIDPYSGGASAGINSDDIVSIPTEIDSSGTVLSWIYARIRNGFLC